MSIEELVPAVEALLFVSDDPVVSSELAEALGVGEEEVEQALRELGRRLEQTGGVQLVKLAGGYQLCTKKEYGEVVARFLKRPQRRLSRSALEVLAIVAYKQPITAQEIQRIRGVDSDHSLRVLVERGLVEPVSRKPVPGRPILYGTTKEFLHMFHLNDLSELPPLNGEPKPEDVGQGG